MLKHHAKRTPVVPYHSARAGGSGGVCRNSGAEQISRYSKQVWVLFLLGLLCGCNGHKPTARAQVLRQMAARPEDPWPRGRGHIVFAIPGTLEEQKSYGEPGGSFSPTVASFGLSLWMTDAQGRVTATSDSIPIGSIQERWLWDSGKLPVWETKTSTYHATWEIIDQNEWRLKLEPNPHAGPLQLVLRSVGPAGGPISNLKFRDGQLTINGRWTLSASPPLQLISCGHEGDLGWLSDRLHQTSWEGRDGWGYARFQVGPPTTVTIRGPETVPSSIPFDSTTSSLSVDLPDPRFAACINAQVVNQMMALVSYQTRPGDPINYPLAWQRDGSYTVVSLARAGQLQIAKRLAKYFIEHDYFGGFGPEADAPGLGIWALTEVAALARDQAFNRVIYPAVRRKAALIEQMLTATQNVREPIFGPIVPSKRLKIAVKLLASPIRRTLFVAGPSRDGLIIGRMDGHQPILFVNAVSYMGLRGASQLAAQCGDPREALHWSKLAADLQNSWNRALRTPERDNERTYISGIWPSWVATDRNSFEQGLDEQWRKDHTGDGDFRQRPMWTYFDVAQAHQWLLIGRQDRVWSQLNWFWNHQEAPGLYTWCESSGEENTFNRWQNVRGWVRPYCVTPHYWTAAEMLLLQLDMLAYVDERSPQPVLVVGAGLRPEWFSSGMSVRNLTTRIGTVDWQWANHRLRVIVYSSHRVPVRLGPGFPPATKLTVEFSTGTTSTSE